MKKSKERVLSEIDALIPSLEIKFCGESGRTKEAKELTEKIAHLIKNTINSYADDGQLGLLEKDFLLQAIFALGKYQYHRCLYKIEDSTRDATEFSPYYLGNTKTVDIINRLTKESLIKELDDVIEWLDRH